MLDVERIRALREALGLSQEEAAAIAGMKSRYRWNDVELGRANITIEALDDIAEALNVHPRELIKRRTTVRKKNMQNNISKGSHVAEAGDLARALFEAEARYASHKAHAMYQVIKVETDRCLVKRHGASDSTEAVRFRWVADRIEEVRRQGRIAWYKIPGSVAKKSTLLRLAPCLKLVDAGNAVELA